MFTRGTRFWHTAISINISIDIRDQWGLEVVGSRSWFPILMGIRQNFVSSRGWRRERRKCIAYEDLVPMQLRFFNISLSTCTPHTHYPNKKLQNNRNCSEWLSFMLSKRLEEFTNPQNPSKIIKSLQWSMVSLVAWRDGTWDMRNPGGPHVTHLTMAFFRMALNGAYRNGWNVTVSQVPGEKTSALSEQNILKV